MEPDDLGLLSPTTEKYCSIRRMEHPEIQSGIFGQMESALGLPRIPELALGERFLGSREGAYSTGAAIMEGRWGRLFNLSQIVA